VERFNRTIKNVARDRVRFIKGNWTEMDKFALDKYNPKLLIIPENKLPVQKLNSHP